VIVDSDVTPEVLVICINMCLTSLVIAHQYVSIFFTCVGSCPLLLVSMDI